MIFLALWVVAFIGGVFWLYSPGNGGPVVRRLCRSGPKAWLLGPWGVDLAVLDPSERAILETWKRKCIAVLFFCHLLPLVLFLLSVKFMVPRSD